MLLVLVIVKVIDILLREIRYAQSSSVEQSFMLYFGIQYFNNVTFCRVLSALSVLRLNNSIHVRGEIAKPAMSVFPDFTVLIAALKFSQLRRIHFHIFSQLLRNFNQNINSTWK